MSGRHRARGTAGWDTPRAAAGRQTGPVGVVGLEGRQGSEEGDDRDRWRLRKRSRKDEQIE